MTKTKRMKNKAYDLSFYNFVSGEKILFDTNIWLYLFPPPGNPKKQMASLYSTAVGKLIEAKAEPVLDPMVLSEYLNRYCRIEWEGYYRANYPEFKDFRQSPDFQQVSGAVKTFAMRILKLSTICSVTSDAQGLQKALEEFATGKIDFNDAVLIDVCKKRGLKFLTNDADIRNGGVEILTINRSLLRACA